MAFWVHILIQIQKTRIKQLKNVNFENFHIRWSNPAFRTVHREMTLIWTQHLSCSLIIALWVHILIQIQKTRIKQLKNMNFENFHIRWSNPSFRMVRREMTIIWTQNLSWSQIMSFWVLILIKIQKRAEKWEFWKFSYQVKHSSHPICSWRNDLNLDTKLILESEYSILSSNFDINSAK